MSPILFFDADGVHQRSFSSLKEASRETNIPIRAIRRSIRCGGSLVGGSRWSSPSSKRVVRPLRTIDEKGVERIYISVIRAATQFHTPRASIYAGLQKNSFFTYCGVTFSYWTPPRYEPFLIPKEDALLLLSLRTASTRRYPC